MPGPPRKPESRRQRWAGPKVLTLPSAGVAGVQKIDTPVVPAGLLKKTRVAWDRFWASDVSQAFDAGSDLPMLERLFQLRDDRERAHRAYRKDPLIQGSQGQSVLNPMAQVVKTCDSEIRALEDRLGLNPQARLRLGIVFDDVRRRAKELVTDGLEPADDEGDDAVEVTVVSTTATDDGGARTRAG